MMRALGRRITVLDKRITVKERFPFVLLLVLILNIYQPTAIIAMALALLFIFFNMKFILVIRPADLKLIIMLSFPILMLTAIGLASGLVRNYVLYDIFKDTYFFVKVVIYFFYGFIVFKKYSIRQITDAFIYTGLISSLIYILMLSIYINAGKINFSGLAYYRRSLPDMSYDPILSVILLLFTSTVGKTARKYSTFLIAFQIIIVLSMLSRFSLIILFIVFLFYIKMKMQPRIFYYFISFFAVIFIFIMLFSPKSGSTKMDYFTQNMSRQFIFKITNIFDELFTERFETRVDIQTNWRAYETAMGVRKYILGDTITRLLGYGFGAMTDIGLRIKLAGIERSDVNIFHNGYIYLLVKLGILGVLAYIYFVSRIVGIIRRNDRRVPFKDAELKKLKAILYLLLFFLICITWVFFGIFNNAIFNNIIILTIIVIFQYEYLTRMRIERFATVPGKV
jgi:hypothetical protein